jgi:serine protease Do
LVVNRFALTLLVAGAAACATPPKPLPVVAPAPKIEPFKLSAKAKQSKLVAVVFDVPLGTNIGTYGWSQSGSRCARPEPLVNSDGRTTLEHEKYLDIYNSAMKARGYGVEDESEIFRDTNERVADLKVAARIVGAVLNECQSSGNKQVMNGSAWLKIEWSIYSNLEKKVIFTTVTEGSTNGEVHSDYGQPGLTRPAFADAVARLAASAAYFAVVDPPAVQASDAQAAVARLRVHRAKALTGDLKANVALIKQAVVTVTANKGSGSGFVISDDGLVLTAAHVVTGSKFVKVNTAAGKECYGEVVSSSKPRDLALIRLDCGLLPALSLSSDKATEGADVYAVGTPLDDKLQFSVTKGVVSGIRKLDDLDYIQSDVSVLPGNSGGPLLDTHGNVIGVTTGGLSASKSVTMPLGVNFFVPIGDLTRFLPVDID